MKKSKLYLVFVGGVFLCGGIGYLWWLGNSDAIPTRIDSLTPTTNIEQPPGASQPATLVTDYRTLNDRAATIIEVARGLDAPWGFVWLPNGALLVTERFGGMRLVKDGVVSPPLTGVPAVLASGQGGLLDVTIHPNFSENQWVYFSYAHGTEEANRLRVARARLGDGHLHEVTVIFETAETKSGSQHFGSRFAWLPDTTLLFSVGDGGNPPLSYNGALIREQAQNLSTHFGKVMRIHDDGSIPDDNPFSGRPDVRPEIYSYGHRNIQGLSYDQARQEVIASEHGSKGGDELNRLLPGGNYGWPQATFATEYDVFSTPIADSFSAPGTRDPLIAWTPTVAPSQLVHYTGQRYEGKSGDIFMAAMLLRRNDTIAAYGFSSPGALLRIRRDETGQVTEQERITLGDVRVRSIAEGPDGYLYALTDATGQQTRPGRRAGAIVRIDSFWGKEGVR
jgi:glucose/arabinose dehydrogenase